MKPVKVYEKELNLEKYNTNNSILEYLDEAVSFQLEDNLTPVRFAITESDDSKYHCEIGVADNEGNHSYEIPSIFKFEKRKLENTSKFNAVLLVPTGIGSEIGGHAGDATPVAKLLSSVCDRLITHPNVVNASDINEMPDNTLYVEGSVITRFLMGTVGLSEARSNRILAVIEKHHDDLFTNAAINAVNAARASYGLDCPKIIELDSELTLSSEYTSSGSAVGRVENLDKLYELLDSYQDEYDAIALATIIKVPREYHPMYFKSKGKMVNPWGGVEAIFTHTLSIVLPRIYYKFISE